MNVRILCVCVLFLFTTGKAHAWAPVTEGYRGYADYASEVQSLARKPFVQVKSLAQSLQGREMFLITIGEGDADSRPAILIVGSMHAANLVGSELAVRLAQQLASDSEAAAALREKFTFYIIPRPNPDASEAFFQSPFSGRTTNLRPHDDDRDGQSDEDGPNDLNGDGFITMMRITDAAGKWMPHPDDPRVLIEADRAKGERGQYSLYLEGGDDDGDEKFNEDGIGGVAFDRNLTFDYDYFAPDVGTHQVSEAETRALVDFAHDQPNIAAVYSFGVNDNLAHAWKAGGADRIKTELLKEDEDSYKAVLKHFEQTVGKDDAPKAADGKGSFVKWAYFHYGRWSFQSPGWWIAKQEVAKAEAEKDAAANDEAEKNADANSDEKASTEKPKPDERASDELNALRYFDANGIAGFTDWVEVDVAGFDGKKVEVGGFRPYLRSHPPAVELDGLAEKHFAFVQGLAEMLPTIAIAEVTVDSLGADVFRIKATFVNDGRLPTMTAMGQANNEPYPLNITLELPEGVRPLIGNARTQIESLAPFGGRAEYTWLVRTDEAKLKLKVSSPAVGSDEKEIELR